MGNHEVLVEITDRRSTCFLVPIQKIVDDWHNKLIDELEVLIRLSRLTSQYVGDDTTRDVIRAFASLVD